MKALTFTFLSFMFAFTLSAQVVIVNSPASLEGAYIFEAGAFGADLTTDVWTGDGIIVDDGSAAPSEGCGDAVIDYTGKIALIDRGACEFGLKCRNAELAGAIGVIVFNNVAGPPVVMGGGAVGGEVSDTIPCVMLSITDGEAIKDAVMNGGANITIGALQFNNDISGSTTSIIVPNVGTIPAYQIAEAGSAVSNVGAAITNTGLNDATNVTVNAVITNSGMEVYNETESLDLILSDSTEIIQLADFDYSGSAASTYEIAYTFEFDSLDQLSFDNAAASAFDVSDNAYSRSSWDHVNNRPNRTNAYTTSGGGAIEFVSGFTVAKGVGYQIDSAMFYVATDLETLEGLAIDVNLYEWFDGNADEAVNAGELTRVGFNSILFDANNVDPDDPAGTWVTLPFLTFPLLEQSYVMPVDGGQYFVGIRYSGDQTVFVGFNEGYDLTVPSTYGVITSDLDLPYIGTSIFEENMPPDLEAGFIFTDLFATLATAMYVGQAPNNTEDVLADDAATLAMFPNPTSDVLNINLELAEQTADLTYTIVDATGKLVYTATKNDITTDAVQVNVANYPAGQYFMTIATDKGIRTQNFTVSH